MQHVDRLVGLGTDNRALTVAALRQQGDQTISELAVETGLSRPTIKLHCDQLVRTGLALEGSRGTSSKGGRPAVTFSLAPGGAWLGVFDVSKHEHRYLLCDFVGRVRAAVVTDVDGETPMAERADLIEAAMRSLAVSAGVSFDAITLFSGSVGGQVDQAGTVVRNPVDVSLLDRDFVDRFRVPVTLENDLKAACYAEHRLGCAQEVNDVVYALVWHQVAAGIVLDGKARRGSHEMAGELNRVTSTASVPPNRVADWGSWPTFLEVLRRAELGDEEAMSSVEEFCATAARQLALLAMSVDPEMIVLGGPLVHRSAYFVEQLRPALSNELHLGPEMEIRLSALRSWGPALGATLRGLEAIETQLVGGPSHAYRLSNGTETELPLPLSSETRMGRASRIH